MSPRAIILLCAALLLWLLSAAARAGETTVTVEPPDPQVSARQAPFYRHSHIYIGGRIMGFAAASTCVDLGSANISRWGGGLGGFAGYRLGSSLSIEGNWSMTLHDGSSPAAPSTVYLMTITADGVYHLFAHGPVEPYVQAGAGVALYGQIGGGALSAGDFDGGVPTATAGGGVDVWVSDYLSLGGRFVYRALLTHAEPLTHAGIASAITVDATATLHF